MTLSKPVLANAEFFSLLPADLRERLEHNAELRDYRPRQIIHFAAQGADFVYVLVSGAAKVSRVSAAGREVILRLVKPREIFGEIALTAAAQYETVAETIGSTRETTTQILGDFQRRGLVRTANRSLTIINVDGLRAIADGARK